MAAGWSDDSAVGRNPSNWGVRGASSFWISLTESPDADRELYRTGDASPGPTRRPRPLGGPRPELRYPPGMRMTLGA
jgi:hypothetical protein